MRGFASRTVTAAPNRAAAIAADNPAAPPPIIITVDFDIALQLLGYSIYIIDVALHSLRQCEPRALLSFTHEAHFGHYTQLHIISLEIYPFLELCYDFGARQYT